GVNTPREREFEFLDRWAIKEVRKSLRTRSCKGTRPLGSWHRSSASTRISAARSRQCFASFIERGGMFALPNVEQAGDPNLSATDARKFVVVFSVGGGRTRATPPAQCQRAHARRATADCGQYCKGPAVPARRCVVVGPKFRLL